MPGIDHDEFASLLAERREATLRARRDRDDALSAMADARSAATADDEHDPEGATLSEEWSRLAGLDVESRRALDEIDRALDRLADGTYGICSGCGRDIPVERLRARPVATTCVACASRSGRAR